MAYRINDEIFFLKIDEQVEYLTQVINEALIAKQDKTDNSLETTNKTIVGAINEVNNKIFTDENIDEIKKELNNKANKADVYTKTEVDNSLNLKFDKASVLQATGTSTSETISQKVITDNLNLKQDKGNYIKLNDLDIASYVRLHTIDPVTTIVIIRIRLFLGSSGLVKYTLPVTMPNNIYAVVTNNSLNNGQTDVWYSQPRVWEKTTTSVTFLNQFPNNYFDCIIINIG